MKAKIRPLAEINREAESILIRELGVVTALRFLRQFRAGIGDYTKERQEWLGELSLEGIAGQIKARRRKQRRKS